MNYGANGQLPHRVQIATFIAEGCNSSLYSKWSLHLQSQNFS